MKRRELTEKLEKIEELLEAARNHYWYERDEKAWLEFDQAFQDLSELHYKLNEGVPIE